MATRIDGYSTVSRLNRELAARSLPELLSLAYGWFATQKGNEARFLAASLIPDWVRLRASLKKSGLVE